MPILRRGGRPGLLGMAARTAVVAGTATAVSGAVAQRQHDRAVEHQAHEQQQVQQQVQEQVQRFSSAAAAPQAPTAAEPAVDVVAKLQQLGELHQQGLLTSDEFARAKQQLLGA